MTHPIRVLRIEDNRFDRGALARVLGHGEMPFAVTTVGDRVSLDAAKAHGFFDCVLVDLRSRGIAANDSIEGGVAIIAEIRAHWPDVPIIALIGTGSEEMAAKAIQAGATDYVQESDLQRVPLALRNEVRRTRLATELDDMRAALDRNRKLFQEILDASDSLIYLFDLDGRCLLANKAFRSLVGDCSEWLAGRERETLLAPDLARQYRQNDEQVVSTGTTLSVEEMHGENRGAVYYFSVKFPMRDETGRIYAVGGISTDITTRKLAEQQLALAATVFQASIEGICITDPNGTMQLVNDAYCRITGYRREELLGQNPRLLNSGRQDPAYYRAMWEEITRGGHWQGEITNRRKDGSIAPHWLSISAVAEAGGVVSHYVGIYIDLSERKAEAERIHQLTNFDALTKLPNRYLVQDRLRHALKAAHHHERCVALMLLDLDGFRLVNEALGHWAGDLILVEIARRLGHHVRGEDTLGRLSGNEFALVIANLPDEGEAVAVARRLLDAVAAPISVLEHSVAVTASIGISLHPRDGLDEKTLLKTAVAALGRSKRDGHSTFRFHSQTMDAYAVRRLTIESGLRDALALGELSLVFQPQNSLDSGRIVGAEALLRWTSAQLGPVSPTEFIPVAEDTGLILPIGEWVLRTVCVQAKRWLDTGLAPPRVAVNVSARQFREGNFVGLVASALECCGLPASNLELELTESAFIQDMEKAVVICRRLKDLGVKLSLDDFGTGYSSLAYISRFPLDKLKIDQSFISDITENPVNAAIAQAAIVMARSLNLTVLAEGVETDAQASFLRGHKCDAIQGYLFSRPLPSDEFGHLLREGHRLELTTPPGEGTRTLLLVDDEPGVLNALNRLFRREGYRVLTAASPLLAFEILAKELVQVVVSDQRMPEMTGTEFLSRVKQMYPDTVRIVLSGYTDLESVTEAVNRGAIYKFLTKPWDDDQLRTQIREGFRIGCSLRAG